MMKRTQRLEISPSRGECYISAQKINDVEFVLDKFRGRGRHVFELYTLERERKRGGFERCQKALQDCYMRRHALVEQYGNASNDDYEKATEDKPGILHANLNEDV